MTQINPIALSKQSPTSSEQGVTENYLGLIADIEVTCFVRLGTLTMTIAQLRQLKQGQVLPLQQKTQEPVDIVLNNQVIARGELMCCDENFAIQITEVCS